MTGKPYYVDVPLSGYQKWMRGALIQHAFPYLLPGEREFLISGVSPEGWDLLPEEDDDEYDDYTVGRYVIEHLGVRVPEHIAIKLDEWESGPIADVADLAFRGSRIPFQVVLEAIDDLYLEVETASGLDQREINKAIDYLEYAVDRSNPLTTGSMVIYPEDEEIMGGW
jgi:hypothetical protein